MIQKLIDAYELKREMYRKCMDTDEEIEKGRAKWDSGLWIRLKVFEETIALAPRVDAIDVVRCKDCKYRYVDGEYKLCLLAHKNPAFTLSKVKPDEWFCADGEKMNEVTT